MRGSGRAQSIQNVAALSPPNRPENDVSRPKAGIRSRKMPVVGIQPGKVRIGLEIRRCFLGVFA